MGSTASHPGAKCVTSIRDPGSKRGRNRAPIMAAYMVANGLLVYGIMGHNWFKGPYLK